MLSGTSSAEDFDGIEKMARHEVEAEAQKWWMDQKFSGDYLPGSYSDLRQTLCLNYDKQPDTYHARMLDLGRRRRKKPKNQPQHWPSCHCPLDATKTSTGRTKYCKNVEAVLSAYECWLENPENQTLRKSQSNLQSTRFPACSHEPTNAHQLRKMQTSNQRRQCRNEEEQIILPMAANVSNFDEGDHCDACYECLQSMKNRWRSRPPWRDDQIMTGVMRRMGVDRDTAERFVQNKREQTLRQESPPSRQHVENANKLKAFEKYESEEHDDEEFCHPRGAPSFHPGKNEGAKKMDPKNVADERKKQGNGAFNQFHTTKSCGLLKSSKSKNGEELHKILSSNDANDHPKDGHLQEETENRSAHKPCKRSTVRQDSSCRQDEESPVNREKASDDTYCELSCKNEDQGTHLHRKNIYASGDLDLHAHKSDMIGLIERVIGNNFGTSLGQQKNVEANEGVMDKGIYTEIMRDLEADCLQQTRNETGTACINQLKLLRWKQMKHIQNEFSRLCTLQQILDNYSPRQSLTPSFEPHSNVVETRTEER